jgi:hypothetical protein
VALRGEAGSLVGPVPSDRAAGAEESHLSPGRGSM